MPQFDAGELVGSKRDRALLRARNVAESGWHDELLEMIAATPEESILENQIMLVPELRRWTTDRVALIGDAAHGLSPHIAVGGTLGMEDADGAAESAERYAAFTHWVINTAPTA
ncbi:FAD-dependent oxidoreductase [Streptomyces sp. NPDC058284]|uniref:FAD-dependent oxidoreductase n=1 Tax=unclassified Streptomyces TaxID=2593676 RepID=UPI00364C5E39